MTSPLRKNRPITPPNSSRLSPPEGARQGQPAHARAAGLPASLEAAVLLGLGAWLAAAVASGADLQWRPAAPVNHQVAAAPSPAEHGRSIVVRRDGDRLARTPEGGAFDPFDEFGADDTATMPATEPAADPPYDPFDDAEVQDSLDRPTTDAAEPSPPSTDQPAAPSVEEAFDEPQPADEPPVDEVAPPGEALESETMQPQIEAGVAGELPTPEPIPAEGDAPAAAPEMENELAIPGLDEEFDMPLGEYEGDLLLQPGVDAPPIVLTPEQLEQRRRQIELERLKHEADCNELLDAVRTDSIQSISLDIRLKGNPGEDFPFECSGRNVPFEPRSWSQVTYLWTASAMCHKPLYFEQVQLERYGHSWGPCLQPIMSGAHFFGTLPILPYKMGLQTPNECVYTLGHYRPGSCAPYMIEGVPFTWRAAAFQAGAWTAGSIIIP